MGTIARNKDHGAKRPIASTGSKKKAAVSPAIADLSNDPYFVKKAESAKRLLDKYGIPKNKK